MKNRGMGFVYQPSYRDKKTGEKKTAATWWISYPNHGEQIRENAHTTNENEAKHLLRLRSGQVGLGQTVGPQIEKTTLADLIDLVETDYLANARKSARRVRQAAVHLFAFFGAERKARTITRDRITAFVAHRLSENAAAASVNYELASLRRGFRLAQLAGKVASCPAISMLHLSNARSGFFERDQYEAVLRHLPEDVRPILQVGYFTGWRLNEILSRQWRHVDFEHGWMRLEPGQSKNSEGRMFPLFPELRAVLEAQRERVREIEQRTGKIVPWVFVRNNGAPVVYIRKCWDVATRAAGVPGRLFHDLRRSAVRNLERAGVPRSAAMKMTGHKTEAVYQRYAIVSEADMQAAAVKLATLHTNSANSQSNGKVIGLSPGRV